MGTKTNPGEFDCYTNAEPDEPMFVLLGRDPLGAYLVQLWADVRAELVTAERETEKLAEARKCAQAMRDWPTTKKLSGKITIPDDVHEEIVADIVQAYRVSQRAKR